MISLDLWWMIVRSPERGLGFVGRVAIGAPATQVVLIPPSFDPGGKARVLQNIAPAVLAAKAGRATG